jgi:hypothetical protein
MTVMTLACGFMAKDLVNLHGNLPLHRIFNFSVTRITNFCQVSDCKSGDLASQTLRQAPPQSGSGAPICGRRDAGSARSCG